MAASLYVRALGLKKAAEAMGPLKEAAYELSAAREAAILVRQAARRRGIDLPAPTYDGPPRPVLVEAVRAAQTGRTARARRRIFENTMTKRETIDQLVEDAFHDVGADVAVATLDKLPPERLTEVARAINGRYNIALQKVERRSTNYAKILGDHGVDWSNGGSYPLLLAQTVTEVTDEPWDGARIATVLGAALALVEIQPPPTRTSAKSGPALSGPSF